MKLETYYAILPVIKKMIPMYYRKIRRNLCEERARLSHITSPLEYSKLLVVYFTQCKLFATALRAARAAVRLKNSVRRPPVHFARSGTTKSVEKLAKNLCASLYSRIRYNM